MTVEIRKLAIIGQGLIGSSITRAVFERGGAREITVTDQSAKVRQRVLELGLGQARVVETSIEAVADADLVIACVPVGQIGVVAREIGPHLKAGAIVSDVGSVKQGVIADMEDALPGNVHLVPAHPLAGTEFFGPDSGTPELFADRWCILTPLPGGDANAVARTKAFWEKLGSLVEIMSAQEHDTILAITSHLPHLIAFSIFHTALRHEDDSGTEVIKFSAGGFRDFTRIASSNPTMWRDIFLKNKDACLAVLNQFMADIEVCAAAIEAGDGEKLEKLFSTSRLTRRRVIEREHVSQRADNERRKQVRPLIRPYASDD
jgi:cyclohexadieny/prephenate dehydrogenase